MSLRDYLSDSADVLRLAASTCKEETIDAAVDAVVRALTAGKALLVCGNGGSAADAMHIAGELVCRFLLERKALRVICLSENPAVLTAWSNDFEFDTVLQCVKWKPTEKQAPYCWESALQAHRAT